MVYTIEIIPKLTPHISFGIIIIIQFTKTLFAILKKLVSKHHAYCLKALILQGVLVYRLHRRELSTRLFMSLYYLLYPDTTKFIAIFTPHNFAEFAEVSISFGVKLVY